MNLGFVCTQPGWGGGEVVLSQLISRLRVSGESVALAAPESSQTAGWAGRASVPLLPLSDRGRSPVAMWRLRRWATENRFDAILLNDPHAITYGGLALSGAGIPRIGVRHTGFPVRSAWKHNRLLEGIVAVSHAARASCVTAGIDRDRVDVIHNGVDPEPPASEAVRAARAMFEEASDGPHVVAIGSLLPIKGFDTLIRAAARANPGWTLWIAGKGPARDDLEGLAAELGVADRVRFLGFRDDVSALLAAADGMASASHNEGLSLVLIEAMLARTPIAATPVGGAREVLGMLEGQVGSPHASVFEPGDPASAARAIESALGAARDRVETAHRWASERFSIDRMAADYTALFARLSKPARRGAAA